MKLIETHAHLYVEEFDQDREEVMHRAQKAGVTQFILPAIDSSTTRRMHDLKKQYPDTVHLMTGLHPVSVARTDYQKELEWVESELQQHDFCAIGEIGIDLHWYPESLKEQQVVFHHQIQLAKERGLPIVIHCRNAFDEVFEVLEANKDARLYGVFHCFTGTLEQANRAIDLGMKLGIGGVVTFKNGGIDKFLHQIPLKHIVLETDAPYLAPSPYRGKRNESSYLVYIAEKLAALYGVDVKEIARQTTINAKEVFRL